MKKVFLFLFCLTSLLFANVIEVNYKDSKVLRVNDLDKVIVFENPDNIAISITDEMMLIEGLKPGKSKLMIIKKTGKVVYVVNVKPRPLVGDKKMSNVDYSGKKFVSNFTAGYGRGDSTSRYIENNWDYYYTYYKMDTKGPTPWGGFYGRVGIKDKKEFSGVYDFNARLDSDIGVFEVGDQYVHGKSTLVMPSQPLQGLSWSNRYSDLQTFLFFGRNNFGYWGSVLEREDMRNSQELAYAKLLYNFDRANQLGLNISNQSLSVLYDWTLRGYQVYGELGKDNNNKTGKDIKLAYNSFNGLNGFIRYLAIDEGFLTPFGIENYAGYSGLKYNLSYRPDAIWDIGYNGETYQNYVNSDPLFNQRDYLVANYRAAKVNELLPNFLVDYSNYRAEAYRTTVDNYEYRNKSAQLKVYKDVGPVSLWYRYRPFSYEDFLSPSNNYQKNQNSVGFKVPLVKPFTYQFEATAKNYDYTITSEDMNENVYDSFFIMNPIMFDNGNMSLDGFYQFQTKYFDKERENDWKSGWKTFHYFMLQYIWYPNPDGQFVIRGYRRLNNEEDKLRADSMLDELRVEYSQNFDYNLRLGGGNSVITGIVFKDENMNSNYDEGEVGVPDVLVKLSSGVSVTTNRTGVYTLRNVPVGDYDLSIEKKDSDIIHTYDHPKMIVIDNSSRVLANFGVLVSGKVHGRVFADIDGNGVFDSTDKPLPGVRVFVNKEVLKTDSNGLYSISADDFSTYTVKVDISSAPFSFNLASQRTVVIEGKGAVDYLFTPRTDIEALDNQVTLTEIREYGNEVQVKGKTDIQVVALYINDERVPVYNGTFSIIVRKIADTLKLKIFTKDNRSYIQRIEYQ
ncbi:MAG: carboxypeptidase-like regulatory domain-containing protein [Erysipelotrichaceae bacterium]|nr:carboxypeptidase-like regulatory domain-containing protein [Erysipelotrichaceae bacterium]